MSFSHPTYCPRCSRRLGEDVVSSYGPEDHYQRPRPKQMNIRVFKNGDWRHQTTVHVACATSAEIEAHNQRAADALRTVADRRAAMARAVDTAPLRPEVLSPEPEAVRFLRAASRLLRRP